MYTLYCLNPPLFQPPWFGRVVFNPTLKGNHTVSEVGAGLYRTKTQRQGTEVCTANMKQDNEQKGKESEKIQTVECGANF